MDLNHRNELLSAYADGELAGDEKEFVERLLQADPTADSVYRGYLALRETFVRFPAPSLGEDFTHAMLEKIASGKCPMLPRTADPLAESPAARSLLERLSRPRIWVYPLASLVIVLLLVPILTVDSTRSNPRPSGEVARTEPFAPAEAPSADGVSAKAAPNEKSSPRVLTPEERAAHLTPPIPLSDRATPRDEQGNPIVLKIESVRVVLAGTKAPETLVSGFDTFLRQWCGKHGVSEITRRSASPNVNACLTVRVCGEDLESLLNEIEHSGLTTERPAVSDDVKRWLSADRSSVRPVEFELTVEGKE